MKSACAVLMIAMLVAGCGNTDQLFHGIRFSRDGSTLVAASLMPSCSCMTVASTKPPGGGDIMLLSRLHGQDVGELILNPAKPVRLRMDWAGPSNSDVYELSAFSVKDGSRGTALVPMQDHVLVYGDPTPTSCDDATCPFGALNLSRAWEGQVGQAEVERHQRGATFTRAGQTLEVSASLNTCGCILLRNPTDTAVELDGRLAGRETGVTILGARKNLQIAYDWAGAAADEVYTISASSAPELGLSGVTTPARPGQPVAPAAPGARGFTPPAVPLSLVPSGSMMTTKMKVSDYALIVGHFDQMSCESNGVSLVTDAVTLSCGFGDLNFNQVAASAEPVRPLVGNR